MLELEVEEGPNRGAVHPIAPGELLIGRDVSCAVLVHDERASRRHARVTRGADGSLALEDLASRNGTARNGLPVPSGAPVPLRPGDRIAIGATVLVVRERDELDEDDGAKGGTTLSARPAPASAPGRDADPRAVLAFIAGLGARLEGDDGDGSGALPAARVRSPAASDAEPRAALARALAGALEVAGGARAALGVRLGAGEGSGEVAARIVASSDPRGATFAVDRKVLEADARARWQAFAVPGRGAGSGVVVFVDPGEGAAPDHGAWSAIATALAPHVLAAEEVRAARREADDARRSLARSVELVGESAVMRKLLDATARAAERDAPVLVTGESGSGKELIARALHEASPRARRRFVAVNAAALPEPLLESELFGHERGAFTGAVARRKGLFELADRGTLFLDEIGELALGAQARLLRVLESGEVRPVGSEESRKTDVRVIAATHRDLRQLVRDGRFREDLYFRLAVLELRVPALRERPDDLLPLARHLLRRIAKGKTVEVDPAALERLRAHPFPGNVRELRNVLERAYVLGDGALVRAGDLPPEIGAGAVAAKGEVFATLADMERGHVEAALRRTGWNRSAAARLLGIDRKTLWAKVKALGLRAGLAGDDDAGEGA